MSIIQRNLSVVMCDHEGCNTELVSMEHLDAVSARIQSTSGGWKYLVAKVGHRPRGGGYRKFDYCPEHARDSAA